MEQLAAIGEEAEEARIKRKTVVVDVEEAEGGAEVGRVRVRKERGVGAEEEEEVVFPGGEVEIGRGEASSVGAVAEEGGGSGGGGSGSGGGGGERAEAGGAVGGERRVNHERI